MTHASLFSGIGGFDLAAEWMGWTNLFNCEWEEFPRQVLKHHFPNAIQHGDIKELDATAYAGRVDILTGGFPCQPYSVAGLQRGNEDERHLWPEMLRVVRECAPRYVVGENVLGLVGWNGGMVFEEVCASLEAEGYAVQPYVLPAASVGAPHRRYRVFFVAYSPDGGRGGRSCQQCQERRQGMVPGERQRREVGGEATGRSRKRVASDGDGDKRQGGHRQSTPRREGADGRIETFGKPGDWQTFPTVPPVCGGDDGLPKELDGLTFSKWRKESIKAYGNAIVPQVALQIFKAIQAHEDGKTV